MVDNGSHPFDSASNRLEFLGTSRQHLRLEPLDFDQIESELAERNPDVLQSLHIVLDRHYPEGERRAQARRAGLRLLHLVYAQGDIEEFERNLTIVDDDDGDPPPSA